VQFDFFKSIRHKRPYNDCEAELTRVKTLRVPLDRALIASDVLGDG
jgi:hypothetical protein